MDEDAINRIVDAALRRDREERDNATRIATHAAVSAALANQTQQVRALRKPDLPNFDKHNVEAWIRRIEKAYIRNGVVEVKDKFAFLEKIFSVDNDPQINEFLEGTTTDDWDDFLAYLREQHGRTKEQQTHCVLNGIPREGRRPTKYLAHILERVGKISLDDVLRELMLKEIPSEVRRHAAPKIKDMDFKETAKYLDNYFDTQGKLLNASTPSMVHSIGRQHRQRPLQSSMKRETASRTPSTSPTRSAEASGFTTAFADDTLDASDVNAVRFKPNGQRQQFQVSNGSQSRGRSRYSSRGDSSNNNNNRSNSNHQRSSSRYNNSSSSSSNNNNNNNNNNGASERSKLKGNVCFYHVNHGKKAENCVEGCMLYSEHKAAKGQASHYPR